METYLIIALAALQLADALTTYKGLSMPGISEGNPVMTKLIATVGLKGFVAAKLALAVVLLIYLPGTHILILCGVGAVYAYAVWNNFKVIRGARDG